MFDHEGYREVRKKYKADGGAFKDVYDKVFTTEAVNIDNIVFKLHYRVTVTALVIFSVVLSLGQVSINIL